MTTSSLPSLFVGDADREEFRETAMWLIAYGAVSVANISEAQAFIRDGFAPALIVVAQAWPGEFSAQQIDELHRAAPLARIVGLSGSWLEGESRTGKPWPATLRSNWRQFVPRHARQCSQSESRNASAWSLPVTAGEDERLSAERPAIGSEFQPLEPVPLIAIYASTRETAESIADMCAQRGWSTIWLRAANSAIPSIIDCVLFDVRNTSTSECGALVPLKSAVGETPIIVLTGFPRIEDIERLKSAGATAVVAKPFLVDDLLWQIEQSLPQFALGE